MQQSIGQIALVVRDYDEAIHFYVHRLGFTRVEDTAMHGQNKRWVVVAPPGEGGLRLLLARALGEEQLSRVGNQTGGRVFLCASPKKRPMAPWLFSRTCMATCGMWCRPTAEPTFGALGDSFQPIWGLCSPAHIAKTCPYVRLTLVRSYASVLGAPVD